MKLTDYMSILTAQKPFSPTSLLFTGPHKVEIAIKIGSAATAKGKTSKF